MSIVTDHNTLGMQELDMIQKQIDDIKAYASFISRLVVHDHALQALVQCSEYTVKVHISTLDSHSIYPPVKFTC